MGMTLCNLHMLQDVFREESAGPNDTVRRVSTGWASLLPELPEGEDFAGPYRRLERLAKQGPGPALLFLYVDDDEFTLSLYAGGKKRASLNSQGKISGKAWFIRALLDDPEAGKKLGLLSRCRTMDEQLALLEETFGLALYDLYDEPPRPVERSEKTYRRVKAREEELKKRKNRFHPVAVEDKDWPRGLKAWFDLRHPTPYPGHPVVPQPPLKPLPFPEWLTKYGRVARIEEFPGGRYHLPDGDSVFRTEAPGEKQAILWRISGKDGSVVNKRTLPEKPNERSWYMRYVPSARVYLYEPTAFLSEEEKKERTRLQKEDLAAYAALRRKEPYPIVVLDDQFQEIQRFALNSGYSLNTVLTVFSGQNAWVHHLWDDCTYTRLNLQTGEVTAIRLETPAFLKYGLVDGTLYALDPQEKGVYCFDETGKLLSRHWVKGRAWLWMENEKMYFWDDQTFMAQDALPQLWRLE